MNYRKEIEELVYSTLESILPDGKNKAIYVEKFSKMSDQQFDEFMEDLIQSGGYIHLVCPANSEKKLSAIRNIELGKKMGYEFFQPIVLTDADTGVEYETPNKYLTLNLPFKRPVQTLQNKVSIPKNLSHVDQRTDQAAGPSRGCGISMPEIQIMASQGLEHAPVEFLKYRGGDSKAFNAMNKSIIQTGGVSQKTLDNLNSRPKSTEVLSILFKAAHLDNNL